MARPSLSPTPVDLMAATAASVVNDPLAFAGFEKQRLTSGATLMHVPMTTAPRIALAMALPGGNCLDPIPGAADLIDSLLLKGTTSRNAEQIAQAIDGLSLEVSFSTRRDASYISATFLPEDTQASLDLIAELLLFSTLDDLPREREKMRGEIQMDLDAPQSVASDRLNRTLFNDTPYGYTESVILENLDRFDTVSFLYNHYRTVYRPDRLVACVVGNLDLVQFAEQFEAAFDRDDTRRIASGTGTAWNTVLSRLKLKDSQVVRSPWKDASQVHVYQSWLLPDANHPDYIPLSVMNMMLGGAGLSSRLFTQLRDKQGLAYSVYSYLNPNKYCGQCTLYIGTEPGKLAQAVAGFQHEVKRLMDEPASEQELQETINNVLGRRSVGLETAWQQASLLLSNAIMGRDVDYLRTLPDKIKAVTTKDIQRVAAAYLSGPSIISAAGPEEALAVLS